MKTSRVKEIWRSGNIALGTLVKSIDPVHTEALSQMDFDFLWYDLEHSDKSVETFSNLYQVRSQIKHLKFQGQQGFHLVLQV